MGIKSKIAALEQEVEQLKNQSLERLHSIDQKLDLLLQANMQPESISPKPQAAEEKNSFDFNDGFIELFEDDENEILDDLIDFFRPANSGKKQIDPRNNVLPPAAPQFETFENESSSNIMIQSDPVTKKGTEPLNGLPGAERNKVQRLENRDFELFCHLLNWFESSLPHFGRQKISRIMTLYADHDYLPKTVYQPLVDVIGLASNQSVVADDTTQAIHALMRLNELFDRTVRLDMKELIEIVEGDAI